MSRLRAAMCLMLCASLTGCALTSVATNFNGLKYVDGSVPVHINLTKFALHLGIVLPLIGDASLDGAVGDFTEEAINQGAHRVRIVQSNETALWWIFPPLSLILTPRFTNIAGDGLK